MWVRLRKFLRVDTASHVDAEKAIEAADESLRVAVSRDREVKRVAAQLRYHREVNHFADRIKASMRGA